MRTFGLIGQKLSHTFSPSYFAQKFKREEILDAQYLALPIETIEAFPKVLEQYPRLAGLNVTIPYKTTILPYLDELDSAASEIGAVNTIQFNKGQLKGFNTDVYGFEQSLHPLLKAHHHQALILGTGGAAKAVQYVLQQLNISYTLVSRSPANNQLDYPSITKTLIQNYPLIINTTPLGMSPHVETSPVLPYAAMSNKHLLYDLVYNPTVTRFLEQGRQYGAIIKNGLEMLHLQAEKAWQIWNK